MARTDLGLYDLGLPPDIVDMARLERTQRSSDIDRIRSAKTEYEEDLLAIQRRIAQLDKTQEKFTYQILHEREVVAERKVMGVRSLMSPVRRVPMEVLDEIFKYYMADKPTQTYAHALVRPSADENAEPVWTLVPVPSGPHPNPVTLCLVSRYWKYVAQATPSLWTDASIKAQEQQGGLAPRVKSADTVGMRKWLERIRNRDWSLSIDAVPRLSTAQTHENGYESRAYPDFDPNAVPLSEVLDHAAKDTLTRITIEANHFAVGLGNMEFPRATSIVVRCCEPQHEVGERMWRMEGVEYIWHGRTPYSSLEVTLPDLPRLPSLTQAVLGGALTSGVINPEIPWHQLTDLYLDDLDPVQWRALIKRCTSLQRGVFTIAYPEPSDEDPPRYTEPSGLITLPHLRELVFFKGCPFHDHTPVRGLTMPALTKLKIFLSAEEEDAWYSFFHWDRNNAPTLFPSLRHLTMAQPPEGMGGLRGSCIVPVIETLPGLQEVFFTICTEVDEVFNRLTLAPGQQLFLPQLLRIGVHIDTKEYEGRGRAKRFPGARIEEAVKSRTQYVHSGILPGAAGLQSLVVHFDDRQCAEKLKEGLRARLSTYTGQNAYGFTAGLFGVRDRKSRLGGRMPKEAGMWKHWDKGFMDFIDRPDEYSLDPSIPAPGI